MGRGAYRNIQEDSINAKFVVCSVIKQIYGGCSTAPIIALPTSNTCFPSEMYYTRKYMIFLFTSQIVPLIQWYVTEGNVYFCITLIKSICFQEHTKTILLIYVTLNTTSPCRKSVPSAMTNLYCVSTDYCKRHIRVFPLQNY